MKVLHIDEILKPNMLVHVARVRHTERMSVSVHGHDFSEIYWIEEGQAVLLERGERRLLNPGYISIIRPGDEHGFILPGKRYDRFSMVMTNVAFRAEALLGPLSRHLDSTMTKEARQALLGLEGVRALSLSLERLLSSGPSSLGLERFILDVLDRIIQAGQNSGDSTLPAWMLEAINRLLRKEEPILNPVETLSIIAGRSREHVSRTLRACTGTSASEYLRSRMLKKAAAFLTLEASEGGSIADIALRSGFSNLSSFYRCFSARYQVSPAIYRKQAWKATLPVN